MAPTEARENKDRRGPKHKSGAALEGATPSPNEVVFFWVWPGMEKKKAAYL